MTDSRHARATLAALAALALASACSTDNAVFLTKTSFGLEASAQPATVNIGYDRFEGYVGPRYETGAIPPVAGSFETNGEIFNRAVRQVYATGDAALMVTGAAVAASSPTLTGKREVMVFNTATTLGVKLGFGSTGVTDTFIFGYKRHEASIIPVTDNRFPSVIATLQNDTSAGSKDGTEFGVQQYFATGDAAVAVAGREEVQAVFRRRFASLEQARHSLNIGTCLAPIADADLAKVWVNATKWKLLGLEGSPTTAQLTTALAAGTATASQTARSTYLDAIAIPNSKIKDPAAALKEHSAFVCGLAGR